MSARTYTKLALNVAALGTLACLARAVSATEDPPLVAIAPALVPIPPLDRERCDNDFFALIGVCGSTVLGGIAVGVAPVFLPLLAVPFASMGCIAALRQTCMDGCIDPLSIWCSR